MRTAAAFALVTAALVAACGGDSTTAPTVSLTPTQRLGLEAAQHAGCASCHGADFAGGVGPGWIGLAGSERPLVDGSTVVADRAYLIESIADPSAKRVAGYSLMMPGNSLSDTEIDQIVGYIEALG
jgi:mono/diheme cytochrome c family protein